MPRARSVKPGLFKNVDLSRLGADATLLFVGLWTLADREGRLKDIPAWIKVEVFPYRPVKVDALLSSLSNSGFIVRYEADGEKYIQVVNFKKHQSPHVKECASTIPAPCKPGASTIQKSLTPDCGLLTPDCGQRTADNGQRVGGVRVADATPQPAPPPNPIREISDALEEAVGRPVDAETPHRLCRETAAAGIHPHLTARWVREKGAERRKSSPIRTPGIFLEDWPAELRAWVSANLGALAGGRHALVESPGCNRCGAQMFRFEDGCIVPCACKPMPGLVRARPQVRAPAG